ncbi:MAG: hypothetical protein KDJ80_10105 [Nitratireductor sp.]|nr:hypothetical protein [Nitratireductor sp.]
MSDSHKEANISKTGPEAGSADADGEAAAGKAAGAPSPARKKGKTPLLIGLLIVLLICGLSLFGALLVMQFLTAEQGATPLAVGPSADREAPVSILPAEPGGVTVLEKQARTMEGGPVLAAPVAAGAGVAAGYAMDVGGADSFLELSRRFGEIVEANGEGNFNRLEPRAVLRETVSGLEARLLIGPFESQKAAEEACDVLVLDEGLSCAAATFEGELISRR